MIIPNIWENRKWQPNHQPAGVLTHFHLRSGTTATPPMSLASSSPTRQWPIRGSDPARPDAKGCVKRVRETELKRGLGMLFTAKTGVQILLIIVDLKQQGPPESHLFTKRSGEHG